MYITCIFLLCKKIICCNYRRQRKHCTRIYLFDKNYPEMSINNAVIEFNKT